MTRVELRHVESVACPASESKRTYHGRRNEQHQQPNRRQIDRPPLSRTPPRQSSGCVPIPASEGQPPRLLIVASDRVSAFDVVLPDPMPGKGVLLTKISTGFFDFVRELNLIPTT